MSSDQDQMESFFPECLNYKFQAATRRKNLGVEQIGYGDDVD